jgi:hypothetical protein
MGIPSDRFSNSADRFLFNGQLTQVGNSGSPARYAIDRSLISLDVAAALTTQVMTCVGVPLRAGDVITNIAAKSGATAAGTPTNWWFALYSSAATPALLAQTADQTTGAWAANTAKTLALVTPQTILVDGVYYVAIMMKATTVVSLLCAVLPLAGASAGVLSGDATMAETSGASLTTTAPATIASPTSSVNLPYVVCW